MPYYGLVGAVAPDDCHRFRLCVDHRVKSSEIFGTFEPFDPLDGRSFRKTPFF
jgi:phosphatidylserine decarboxylase